jgi:hypothetical protein
MYYFVETILMETNLKSAKAKISAYFKLLCAESEAAWSEEQRNGILLEMGQNIL